MRRQPDESGKQRSKAPAVIVVRLQRQSDERRDAFVREQQQPVRVHAGDAAPLGSSLIEARALHVRELGFCRQPGLLVPDAERVLSTYSRLVAVQHFRGLVSGIRVANLARVWPATGDDVGSEIHVSLGATRARSLWHYQR